MRGRASEGLSEKTVRILARKLFKKSLLLKRQYLAKNGQGLRGQTPNLAGHLAGMCCNAP